MTSHQLILLMNEISHQLIWKIYLYLRGFKDLNKKTHIWQMCALSSSLIAMNMHISTAMFQCVKRKVFYRMHTVNKWKYHIMSLRIPKTYSVNQVAVLNLNDSVPHENSDLGNWFKSSGTMDYTHVSLSNLHLEDLVFLYIKHLGKANYMWNGFQTLKKDMVSA